MFARRPIACLPRSCSVSSTPTCSPSPRCFPSGKKSACHSRVCVITIVITVGEDAMVELKVRKFGNSLGVVLPKDVINRLQTGDGEKLYLLEVAEGDYRLTPYDPAFEKQMERVDDIMSRYRNTLRALAK